MRIGQVAYISENKAPLTQSRMKNSSQKSNEGGTTSPVSKKTKQLLRSSKSHNTLQGV